MNAPVSLRRKIVAGLLAVVLVAVVQWVIFQRGRMPEAPLSAAPTAALGK